MTEPPATLPSLLASIVASRAGHDAITMPHDTLTYAELDRRTARMAKSLLAIGAGKGTRIALLAPDGIFWITSFLASLRIGALLTLVSTLCTAPELGHMLRHSDTQILIAARHFLKHDYGQTLAAAFPDLAQADAAALHLSKAPFLRSIWLDDASDLAWAKPVAALLAYADAANAPSDALLAAAEAEVTPADDAVIVYTSGSTALPKAVVHTQWNISRHPPALAQLFLIAPEDRMLPMLPAFWLGGLAMALQVLSQGATLVYPPSPNIPALIETIRQCRVTRVNGWGDGLVRLRLAARDAGIDTDAILGLGIFRDQNGDPIPPMLQSNMLGMSESFAPHSAEKLNFCLPDDKVGASGRAVNNYQRRVIDPATGQEVAPGDIGELQLRGGALMSGFYKKRRDEVFTADGFYPTGDLVRIDAEGFLTFIARRHDMIKTRAANVSRLEVEAALNALPEVAFAAVTGLADAEFGQIVAAAVVPAPGASPNEDGLRAALRETLSSYKLPKRIVFVDNEEIPRTATGKIKLHELGQLFASGDRALPGPSLGMIPQTHIVGAGTNYVGLGEHP